MRRPEHKKRGRKRKSEVVAEIKRPEVAEPEFILSSEPVSISI
jgi:hypothetical protein